MMSIIVIAPRVDAGFSPSEVLALKWSGRPADLLKIQKVIETKMIRKRLEAFGFTQQEIHKRLSRLDDQQIHQLALKLDELKVGGGWEVIVVLLLIAILVVLLLEHTGKKVVIKSK